VRILIALVLTLAVALGCPAESPSRRPEAVCTDACVKRAKDRCDEAACNRGCAFVLDRTVEGEHLAIIDCVAHRTGTATLEGAPKDEWRDGKCGDREWAECAVRVGVHADGGPAAPPPIDERPRD